jgi:hypothetical protein
MERSSTKGTLASRLTKNTLEKNQANNSMKPNTFQHKTYRNILDKTVCESKKLYFCDVLEKNVKNLKKTWSLFYEV